MEENGLLNVLKMVSCDEQNMSDVNQFLNGFWNNMKICVKCNEFLRGDK